MLRTLDRYLIREVLPPSLVALIVFTFTLELQPLTRIGEPLIQNGAPWMTTLRVMLMTAPQALALTIPMSLLCGVLVAMGRLSADSEYRVMQACGISPLRLLRPILVLASVFSIAAAYVGFAVAPPATTAFRTLAFQAMAAAGGDIPPRVFVEAFPNQTIFFRDRSAGGMWRDVFMADESDPGRPTVYLARDGHLEINPESQTLGIVLRDGTRHVTPAGDKHTYEFTTFAETVMYLDWKSMFPTDALARTPSEMTVAELQSSIADRDSRGERSAAFAVELHRRFFVPAVCIALAVLGLAIGGSIATTGKLGSFAVGVCIVFLCYVMMFTGRAMVMSGLAPAWVAMWYPMVLLSGAAIALLIWRMRGGTMPALVRPRTAAQPGGPGVLRFSFRVGAGGVGFAPRTLDRYLVRLYLAVWALSFAGLVSLSYASLFTELLTDLFRTNESAWLAGAYFVYQLPVVTYYVVPVATLLSVLVTIGMLTKSNEIAAMKACGISLYRIAVPMLVTAAVMGIGVFGIQERLMPESTRRAEAIRERIRGRPAASFRQMNRKWVIGRAGTIYKFDRVDAQHGGLQGLSVFEMFEGEWQLRRRITAAGAVNRRDEQGSEYSWQATSGDIWTFSTPTSPTFTGLFSSLRLRMEPIAYFKDDRPEAERMSYLELSRHIENLRTGGANVAPYVVALYRKLSFPFVTLVMTLLAVPFAVTTGKTGAAHGIGVGAVLAFTYWAAMSMFGALGSAGALTPALAAWAPNLLFGAGGAYLLLRTRT